MFIIDYGTRTLEDCVIDGIGAIAREILSPQYAPGDAAHVWALRSSEYVRNALTYPEDSDARAYLLSEAWEYGADHLHAATGLRAFEDPYAGGLFFLTDDELAALDAPGY